MDYILIGVAAFLLELTGAVYTVSLTRGKWTVTIILSALNALISWGVVYVIIYNVALLPAAVLGVVAGTTVALWISHGKRS